MLFDQVACQLEGSHSEERRTEAFAAFGSSTRRQRERRATFGQRGTALAARGVRARAIDLLTGQAAVLHLAGERVERESLQWPPPFSR